MQFVYGALTTVFFIFALLSFYYIGLKQGQKPKQEKHEVDRERQKEIERFDKHFKELFSYDVEKAYQRKKVT
jgi:hypothetical protein